MIIWRSQVQFLVVFNFCALNQTTESMRTDSDSTQISLDSIGLRAIPHQNGVEYMGESKDLMKIHSEKLLAISRRLETAAHLCGHIGFRFEQVINVLVVHYTTFVVNEVMCLDKFSPALCGVVVELLSM